MIQNRINTAALYIGLFILLLLGAAAVKSFFVKPEVFTNIERIREIRDDSINYWKDVAGREHAQKIMAVAEMNVIKEVYGPFMDSVLHALGNINGQLNQVTVMGVASTGRVQLRVDTIYIDSTQAMNFNYKDRWIDITGTIGRESYLQYSTFDSLIVSSFTKRRGFLGLGRKDTYIDAYSLNPHSKISGLQGIQIAKERPRRFGVGPYVGFGYAGGRWWPMMGFGLNYSLLKF